MPLFYAVIGRQDYGENNFNTLMTDLLDVKIIIGKRHKHLKGLKDNESV